jgi:hypothetical protein
VTHVVDIQVQALPAGIVRGVVRKDDGGVRICQLEVVIDTMTSKPYRDVRPLRT